MCLYVLVVPGHCANQETVHLWWLFSQIYAYSCSPPPPLPRPFQLMIVLNEEVDLTICCHKSIIVEALILKGNLPPLECWATRDLLGNRTLGESTCSVIACLLTQVCCLIVRLFLHFITHISPYLILEGTSITCLRLCYYLNTPVLNCYLSQDLVHLSVLVFLLFLPEDVSICASLLSKKVLSSLSIY